MRPRLAVPLALALALACAPKPAGRAVQIGSGPDEHVRTDLPDPPGLLDQAGLDPDEPAPPLRKPPAPPSPPAFAPLVAGPGARIVLEVRGWEVAALPDRVIVLDDDFLHVRAFDPATGQQLWRTKAQDRANGMHTLYVVGDRVLLHAGPDLVVLDGRQGKLVGRHPAWGYNGGDDRCHLRIVRGLAEPWRAHVPFSAADTACASSCACSLRLFRCDTGAPIGEPIHSSVTHLYHSLDAPHDNVCWTPPRLLGRVGGRTLLALEHGERGYVAGAVDGDGKPVWTRPELADAVRRFVAVDGDAGADACWSIDDNHMTVWTCTTGQILWREAYPDQDGHVRSRADLVAPGRLLVRRRSERHSRVELRALADGKRPWERTLAGDRIVLTPGEDPGDLAWAAPAVYAWIDPATGATLRELTVTQGQALVLDPGGGYLRVGGPDHAELDREGRLVRTVPRDIPPPARVGERFLVVRRDQRFSVLRRPGLDVALEATGNFVVDESSDALGPAALLLYEHRGSEPLRVALLRATDGAPTRPSSGG